MPFRLRGREALFIRGEEGVALFYDESQIRRHGAMPAVMQESPFGRGSVHSLDGDEHRHRKATFVDVLYDDEVARLLPELERQWQGERDAWVAGGERSAYDAAVGALGRAIVRWADVELDGERVSAGGRARHPLHRYRHPRAGAAVGVRPRALPRR